MKNKYGLRKDIISILLILFISSFLTYLMFNNMPRAIYHPKNFSVFTDFYYNETGTLEFPFVVKTQTANDVYFAIGNYDELKNYFSFGAKLFWEEPAKRITDNPVKLGTIQPTDELSVIIKYHNYNFPPSDHIIPDVILILKPAKLWGFQGITLGAYFVGIFTILFQIYKFLIREVK